MKNIESACRIALVSFVFLVWMLMFGLPLAIAHDDDDDKPKPKPPVTTPAQPAGSSDHHKDAFWFGAVGGGLAITSLQKTEHPWIYSTLAGLAVVGAMAATDNLNHREAYNAALGVVTGTTGTGLVFGKGFFGWQTVIKF